MRGRNWKEYNDRLVKKRRGLYLWISLRNWDEELCRINKGKVGRPFSLP